MVTTGGKKVRTLTPTRVSVFRKGKSWLIACLVLGALVLSWGPKSITWAADFDAQAQDIWLDPSIVYEDDTADVKAKFKNLSSSSGPYGGEATFDVAIIVSPPSGPGTRHAFNNRAFSYNQEQTYRVHNFAFNQTGTYTVYAEVYDINGEESGWDAAHRFDRLSETFTIDSPPELDASPNSHDFGTVTGGSTPAASFRVTNDGSGTLQWGVDSWPDWVDILEPLYSGVTGAGTVRIRVRSDAALGRHSGRITFNSNGGDDPITLSVRIVAPPSPELDASPNSHDFGTVTRGSTPEASFRVTNDGTGALEWGVDSWPDWVDILEPLYSGVTGDGTVRIRVRSDAALGRHSDRITFNSNGGDDPITLSASIVAPPSPELDASPNSHDFGTVTGGSTPAASFRVTNDGTGALEWGINSRPDWVEILEPLYSGVTGDGTVRIRVKSDAALGRHSGRITFNSNGGDDSINLSVRIVAPPPPVLVASPNSHDFGTVTRGSTPEASFRVTNDGTGALEWGINSWPDWVDILEPLYSGVTGDGTVRIRVRSDAALGSHSGRITFNSNGGNDPITLLVRIVAPPPPELFASPNGHDFGTVTGSSTPEASFRVNNYGTGTLQWEVYSWPDWVDILEPLYSGVTGDGTVRIRVRSDAAPGRHTGRITFNSNGGDDPITLSVNIVAPPPPELAASPNGHDFGTVTGGSTPEASFRVNNYGTGTLQWEVYSWPALRRAWTIRNGHPSVGTPGRTGWWNLLYSGVNGDGTVRIRVRSDATLGRHTGRITFNSNGGDDPITLSVDIVAPPSPELVASPNGHDFGTVTGGSTAEASFRVTNDGTGTLQWGVDSWPDWVDILEPRVSGVNGDGTVRIRVRSDATLGRHSGRITFNSNGGDDPITLSASIVAPPSPELNTSPNGHDFGTVTRGSTPETSFSVTNFGGGLLRWSVLSRPSWVTVLEPSTSNEFGSGKIRVQMLNTAPEGNHARSIEVESNGGNHSIPLSAEVKPAESLRLEPPTNLTVVQGANDSINLSWDPPRTWVEGFELYVTESGSSRHWTQIVDGPQTDAWVRNLVPDTEYKLSVAAFHGAKQSSQSTPVTGATYPRRASTSEVIIESNRQAAVHWDGDPMGTIDQPVGRVGPRYQFRIASATQGWHEIKLSYLEGTTTRTTTTGTWVSIRTPTLTKLVYVGTNGTLVGPVVLNFSEPNSGVDDASPPLYLPPDNVRAALVVGNEVLIAWDILPDAPVKRFSIEQRTPDSEAWTIVNAKVHSASRAATVRISAPTEVLDYRVTAIYENSTLSSYPVRAAATLFVLADETTPDIRTATEDLAEKLRQRPGLETLVVREADLRHSSGSPNLADYNLVVIGEPSSDSQLISLVTEVFESTGESAVLDPEGAVTFARRSIDCEGISVRADAGVLEAPHPLNPNLTTILISGEEIHVEEIIRSSGWVTGVWDWGKDTVYGVAFLLQIVFTKSSVSQFESSPGRDFLSRHVPGILTQQEVHEHREALIDLAVYAWENPSEAGAGVWNSFKEPYAEAWRCGDSGYLIGYAIPDIFTFYVGTPIKAARAARTLRAIGINDNLASSLGKSGKYAGPLEDLVKRVDKVGSKQDKDGLRDAITRGAATKAGKAPDAQGKAAFEAADEFLALRGVLGYEHSLRWIQTHMGPVGKRYNDLSFEDATKILAEQVKAGRLDEAKFKKVVDEATDPGKQSEVRLAAAFVQEGWQLVDVKHIILGKFDKNLHKGEIDFLVRREGITMGVETSLHFKMKPSELAFKQNYVRTVLEKNPHNDVMYIGVTSSKKIRGGEGGADALEGGSYLWAHIEP